MLCSIISSASRWPWIKITRCNILGIVQCAGTEFAGCDEDTLLCVLARECANEALDFRPTDRILPPLRLYVVPPFCHSGFVFCASPRPIRVIREIRGADFSPSVLLRLLLFKILLCSLFF